MKPDEIRDAAQQLFTDRRSPFGAFSLGSETHRPVTMPDAVRRCRWIAVDLNASGFGLFLASPSPERAMLLPCFDSLYPGIAPETKAIAGESNVAIMRHARISSTPCWWNDGPACASSRTFEALAWCAPVTPLAPGSAGIVFPVQSDRGQSGIVVFLGADMALDPSGLFEIHARCFSLFDAVARMRPGDAIKVPSISKRELECLKLTANGYTSEDIARLLKLSIHTANQYLSNTVQKLNAVNRMQAVAKALRMGLIE